MPSVNDVQRLFLQAALSRGVMSQTFARLLWKKCAAAVQAVDPNLAIPPTAGEAAWNSFVQKLNQSLDPLNLEFRQIRDEEDDSEKLYCGLVNAKGDEVAQMATDYSPAEIAFFRNIIEAIMTASNESFSVSSLAALREVNNITPKTNMTKAQAEIVLDSFVARGWLLKSKKARYTLSTRSLLELTGYIKQNFPNELIECTICLEMLTRGVACYTPNCKARVHRYCFTHYLSIGKTTCPACNAKWPKKWDQAPLIQVGEAAAREGDDNRRQSRRHRSEEAEEEEVDYEEEEDTPSATQPQSQSQSQRPKRSQRARN